MATSALLLNDSEASEALQRWMTAVVADPVGFNETIRAHFVFRNPAGPQHRTPIIVAYLFAFCAGIFGNGLVMYVLLRHGHVRVKSVANYYIGNLAVADFCFVATLPLFCWSTYAADWPFGGAACKLASAAHYGNRFVSIFTLVALSVDRYVASHYDLSRWRTLTVGKVACAAVWAVALALTTPYWLYSRTTVANGGPAGTTASLSCRLVWPNVDAGRQGSFSPIQKTWTRVLFAVGFAIPFAAIVAAYAALGARLRRLLSTGSKAAIKRPGRAMTRTTIVVTVTFVLTQLPYHIVEMLNAAKSEQLMAARRDAEAAATADQLLLRGGGRNWTSIGVREPVTMSPASSTEMMVYVWLNTVAKLLLFLSSCCNPIIYGLLNHNYRSLYAEVLFGSRCCCCCCIDTHQLIRTPTADATAGGAMTDYDGDQQHLTQQQQPQGSDGTGPIVRTPSRRRRLVGRGSSRRSTRGSEGPRRAVVAADWDKSGITESVELTRVDGRIGSPQNSLCTTVGLVSPIGD